MAEPRMVKCIKLSEELPGIDETTYEIVKLMAPEELAARIYENVSQRAWEMWKEFLIMVINEYRLTPSEPESDELILSQMEEFFFGEDAALPPGYVPPQGKM
ncbi:MAG: oxidative damage protection protein [Candidatus Tectomicrobia bacterium]|nr:oxidative damage protection protein [Candidatus Tectomicrobia bacterium]